MISILLFTALAIVAIGMSATLDLPRAGKAALLFMAPFLFIIGLAIGSSVVVPADMTGLVIKHFGKPLPAGHIVARTGEQGPQSEMLGPGWHFFYIPLLYEVKLVPVALIEHGKLGFVTARDGAPLPDGETFAAAWASASDMLNPTVFLEKGGQRGPQITVLTPGTWRYNPFLHDVQKIEVLTVPPGSVAVITSRTGPLPKPGPETELVNGVPLVEQNQRGIWREPLKPGAYYINTQAHSPTIIKTTQRIYTYQQAVARQAQKAAQGGQDWSVTVRSKDGFSFPIDVRLACAVEAKNAPWLVALLGDPDQRRKDEQEDEDLEILEAKIILPSVRAVFRNVAENMSALEFVNARSQMEKVANDRLKPELAKAHITCDGVFLGNIHLDATEAGRRLIATQTDREVAVNEQTLFAEQKKAQEARAAFVKAQEEAEQQRNLAKAIYEVQVKEQGAKARAAEAKGEADYQTITGDGRAKAYDAMVKALGRDQVAQIELLKIIAEGKVQIAPQVMVNGGAGAGSMDALMGTMLRQAAKPQPGAGTNKVSE
jgi:regulator of protease activity HflC (stomatin/prohibitin superfamily)